ncbi:MAG TPA: general secretion pathway protein GspB [Syntrophales bacterium]|nr:general secretion pathway protein GspB [Syntrophales bacterium]
MKLKKTEILKYLRKIFDSFTKTALLIVFTTVIYILLLYCFKYLWFLFISTPVGQAYAVHFSYSYQISNDVLSTNFINHATKITVTSFIISLIIGSICQFFLIIRYFYSNRGLFGRIVFFGLPLAYMVAACVRYMYDFGDIGTAFTIAVIPTLCVFTGGFRIAKEYVPELVDIIFIISGQQRKTSSKPKEEEAQRRADELIQKEDAKQSGTDWQIKLKYILESYAAYIIVILIIIVVAGITLTTSQAPNFNNREESAAEAPKVEAPITSPKPDVPPTPQSNFTYSGYSYDEKANRRLAIIDGKIYHEGDLLPGNYVLKSIKLSYIIIRNKANKEELVVPLY